MINFVYLFSSTSRLRLLSPLIIILLAVSASAQRKNLIAEIDFENGERGAKTELDGGSLAVVDTMARAGKRSLKVSCTGVRAEITDNGAGGPNKPEWRERWFAVSVFIPNDFKGNPKGSAMFLQIHERPDACENWRSPPLNFSMRGDEMWITVKWEPKACSPKSAPEKQIWKDSASKYKGRWSDWVLHTIWSYKEDGLTEAWVDGKKVVTYRGPNAYNDQKEYYWKSGMYKRWDGLVTHYMDELRVGNGNATYADVAPTGSAPPTDEPSNPVPRASISLNAGWNLLSLPIVPSDNSIDKVFAGISGKFDAIYGFDGTTYQSYIPGEASNTLSSVDAGRGYWVYMSDNATLEVTGSAAPKDVSLKLGWNLVGFNSTTSTAVGPAFSNLSGKIEAVYSFDSKANTYRSYIPGEASDLSQLEPGQGYWVYANESVTWTIS
jgi:hypothetical protein